MNSPKDFIKEYEDQIRDIFEHFNATPHFHYIEKANPYGGNPESIIRFSFEWGRACGTLESKTVDFKYQPTTESIEAFANRIRAYMFGCVDMFVNLF